MKKTQKRLRRKERIRTKLMAKSKGRPRLTVFRSNKYIYAQIIGEDGKILVSAGEKKLAGAKKETKTQRAKAVGTTLAEKALKQKIKKVYFDRSGYKFHGRVKT